MKRNRILILAAMALMVAGLMTSCKSSGMAMTSRGQLFKINIYAPTTLAEGADGNVDVVLSNRGVNNVSDILADVELPPQLIVLDQTNRPHPMFLARFKDGTIGCVKARRLDGSLQTECVGDGRRFHPVQVGQPQEDNTPANLDREAFRRFWR